MNNSSNEVLEVVQKASQGDQLRFLGGSYDCTSWTNEMFDILGDKQLSFFGSFDGTERSISDRKAKSQPSVLLNFNLNDFKSEISMASAGIEGLRPVSFFDGFVIDSKVDHQAKDPDCTDKITTFYNANNLFAGNMFDLTASGTENILIEGFDLNLEPPGTNTLISVYYRPGTYEGFQNISEGWTLMGTTTVIPQGLDIPTYVDIGGLEISAGETYGIYITVTSYPSTSMQYTNGNLVTFNDDLTITAGIGKGDPDFTGENFVPRTWNGTIYYNNCVQDCDFTIVEGNINCDNGSSSCDLEENTYTVVSEGCYSSSACADQTAFAQQELCGNGTFEVEVLSISNKGWAGIQMRESNAPVAKMVALKTQLSNFLMRESRISTNGLKKRNQLFRPNTGWLRITRNDNNFQCFSSTNGIQWQFAMSANIVMPECIEMGMFVESINSSSETEAVFGNVNFSFPDF